MPEIADNPYKAKPHRAALKDAAFSTFQERKYAQKENDSRFDGSLRVACEVCKVPVITCNVGRTLAEAVKGKRTEDFVGSSGIAYLDNAVYDEEGNPYGNSPLDVEANRRYLEQAARQRERAGQRS